MFGAYSSQGWVGQAATGAQTVVETAMATAQALEAPQEQHQQLQLGVLAG
jgi:hypothetical protein